VYKKITKTIIYKTATAALQVGYKWKSFDFVQKASLYV